MRITDIGIEINKRFFEALDMLIQERKIRGIQTFTNQFDINRWNLYSVKKEPTSRFIKAEWLSFLVIGYSVSAEWLLTGRGEFYKK